MLVEFLTDSTGTAAGFRAYAAAAIPSTYLQGLFYS